MALGPICTDTRQLQRGQTFVALRGDRFNGEEFVPAAIERGAAAVITAGCMPDAQAKATCLRVPDALRALGDLAHAWRGKMKARVVAVSGSAGKTTTKEMLAHICRAAFATHATRGNLNNLIGLPMTLLELNPEHDVAIIETGMNVPDELRRLTSICRPDLAILTNIGDAHLGNFESPDALIRAEGEILEAMPADAPALLNADCPGIVRLCELMPIDQRVTTYGQLRSADVFAQDITACEPHGYRFRACTPEGSADVFLPHFGRYQIYNALAAIAAARALSIPVEASADALSSFEPPKLRSRMEVLDGVLLVEDCYNSSPDAAGKALLSLADLKNVRRRFALLGDMNELGAEEEGLHRKVGRLAAQAGLDALYVVGQKGRWILDEAQRQGLDGEAFATGQEAAGFLAVHLSEGDALLVKASRTVRLEEAVARLRELRRPLAKTLG